MKKRNISILTLVLGALMFLGFEGCIKQEYGIPNIPKIPMGKVITVEQLRDICPPGNTHTFVGDTSLVLVVAMDDKSGNLYKEAYAQDHTGGVLLRTTSAGGLYQGDSLYINLNGLNVQYYRKVFQVDSVSIIDNIVKLGVGIHVEPEVVSIPDLKTWEFESKLIRLENVQFIAADTAKTYADADNLEYGELTIEDEYGYTVMLRTSGYAKFARELTPGGSGSITAIAGRYDDIVQLAIRRTSEVKFDGPRLEGVSMEGTFDNPYTVAYAIANNSGTGIWVSGYLVGVMETNTDPFAASFAPPFFTNSNVLLADSPNETNLSNCLIVQLPVGSIRNAVNLVNNPGNLGKEIMLHGNLEKYFGVPGLKETDGYWLDGAGIVPVDPIEAFFEEYFTSDLGVFTAHNILGDQVWGWANYDGGCAMMSGHTGGSSGHSVPNEDWLVSPQIDLSGKQNVHLALREAINYSTFLEDVQVYISTSYSGSGLPTLSGEWTLLNVTGRASGTNFTFVDCNPVDLSFYDGEKVYIGFKYTSSTTRSATWEVSQVALYEKEN